jgi:hypothetical protein
MEIIDHHYLLLNYNNNLRLHYSCTYKHSNNINHPIEESEYRPNMAKQSSIYQSVAYDNKQLETFLIIGLFVGTIVTLSL